MRERTFTPRGSLKPHRPPRGGPRRPSYPAHPGRGKGGADVPVILYGWHTVKAALENPARRIRRLYVTENAARRLGDEGVVLPLATERVRPDAIAARLEPDAVHQGLLAEADPLPAPAKSASGALEYVPIVTVQNLARALTALKERGYLLVGLDSTGNADLDKVPMWAPLALVLGAEGKGLRQLSRTTCDHVARLKLPGRIKSLNVSNAAALALYVATKRLAAGSR